MADTARLETLLEAPSLHDAGDALPCMSPDHTSSRTATPEGH